MAISTEVPAMPGRSKLGVILVVLALALALAVLIAQARAILGEPIAMAQTYGPDQPPALEA